MKVDGATIGDAEDLDSAVLMYHLLEYSAEFTDTSGSLLLYSEMKQLILLLILRTIMPLNLLTIKLSF